MNPGVIQYPWKRISTVVDPTARVPDKDQIKVLVDSFRVRTDHNTTAESIGFTQKDGYYFDLEQYADGTYTWHRIADNQWVADNGQWVEVLPGVTSEIDQYKKQIKTLEAQVKDLQNQLKNCNEALAQAQIDISEKEEKIKTFQTENYKLQASYNDLLEDYEKVKAAYERETELHTADILKIEKALKVLSE